MFVAFVVVGPKDLPKVARFIARGIKKLRNSLSQIKQESGWLDIERELNEDIDISHTTKELNKEIEKINHID